MYVCSVFGVDCVLCVVVGFFYIGNCFDVVLILGYVNFLEIKCVWEELVVCVVMEFEVSSVDLL